MNYFESQPMKYYSASASMSPTEKRIKLESMIESGEYLCDVTYFVNTLGNNGYVVTENDARIIVVWLENGLFAKEMMSY